MCRDTLFTTSLDRLIIDMVLEMFQLDTRMNGTMRLKYSVLVHDEDDRASL